MLTKEIKCDLCGAEVRIFPENVSVKKRTVEGEELTCTYLNCPTCEGKTLQQIDNEETLQLRQQAVALKIAEMSKNRHGKALLPKQRQRAKDLNIKLDLMRKQLKLKHYGVIYQLDSEEE